MGLHPAGPTGPGAKPHYLVINADEGEPGTCKDIPLMMADPHSLIEGCIITCYAIRAHVLRDLHPRRGGARDAPGAQRGQRGVRRRATSARTSSAPGYDLDIVVHARRRRLHLRRGDGAAGLAGRPPRPAAAQAAVPGHAGLYACPTVVNNVETIASRPGIVLGGSRLVPVDGHREVARPEDLLAVRARHPARPVRGADGHHAAAAAGAARAACRTASR